MERDNQQNQLAQPPEDRLRDLFDAARVLTDTVGAIHEFQAVQMRNWPLVVLDGAVQSEAHVDIGDARNIEDPNGNLSRRHRLVTVVYKAVTDPSKRKPRNHKKKWADGAQLLADWTRELFWPDTIVRVLIDGQEILDGSTKPNNTASRA